MSILTSITASIAEMHDGRLLAYTIASPVALPPRLFPGTGQGLAEARDYIIDLAERINVLASYTIDYEVGSSIIGLLDAQLIQPEAA